MAFDGLTGSIKIAVNWNAQKNAPSSGLNFPATQNSNTTNASQSVVLGGNVANGSNEFINEFIAIPAASSTTFSLQAQTDVLNFANVVLVRVKQWFFWLVGLAEDSVNGTAASSVAIQGGASNPNTLCLGGTTPTYTLKNGDGWAHMSRDAAGITISGAALNLKITNNDGSNAANVLFEPFGATT